MILFESFVEDLGFFSKDMNEIGAIEKCVFVLSELANLSSSKSKIQSIRLEITKVLKN